MKISLLSRSKITYLRVCSIYYIHNQTLIELFLIISQYKVLQRGCWEKPNFERTQTQLNNGNQSSHLLENQFIQHSSPASAVKGLEVTARDIPQHGKLVSEVVHFQGQKYRREVFGLAKRSKQLSSCYSAICHQDSIGSNTGKLSTYLSTPC